MPSFFHPIFGHGNEHLEEQHLYNALNAFMAQPTTVTVGPSELAAEYGTALPSSAMGSEYHHQGNQLYDASELNFSDYLHDEYATVTEAAPPHEPSFVSAAYTASANDPTLDYLFEESASVTEGAPSHEPSFVATAYTDVSAPSNVPGFSSVSAPDNFFAPVNVSSQAQHQHQPDELPTSSAAEVVTATDTSCIDPQLLAGPEPIVTPASALEALRIEWWNHFNPGQAPKYPASAAPAPVPTSSNINGSSNGSTCASVAHPPATPAVDTAAAPATPAASVVSAKSGRDLDKFDESDVLGAVSKDYAKRTIYKSATEARDSQRRRVQTREDPSIPRDEETKRALVAVLVEALESTEHAVDSEKTIQPFRAGRYTKEVLEVAAWDLMVSFTWHSLSAHIRPLTENRRQCSVATLTVAPSPLPMPGNRLGTSSTVFERSERLSSLVLMFTLDVDLRLHTSLGVQVNLQACTRPSLRQHLR